MDSALTPLVKLSFYIHNCIYYLFDPIFVKVDHNSERLASSVINNPGPLIPWFITQTAAFLLHLCLPVYILLQGLSQSSGQKLNSNQAAVLIIYAIYEMLIIFILLLIRKHINHCCVGVARLLEMEQNIIQGN